MNPYEKSARKFNTLNDYYLEIFHKKVFKIALNANFTCPSKCSYCSELGSGDYAGNKTESLQEQFIKIKEMMHHKWSEGYYIVYFQANTNTYAPLAELKIKYEEAISLDPLIRGIAISTRPDCISDELITYLVDLNKKIDVQIELGLQSANNQTLIKINRNHDVACFIEIVNKLHQKKLKVVAHIINGLPGENEEDMLNTIKLLANLKIDGVKFHMLTILKNTKMYQDYLKEPFNLLSLEEYVKIVSTQITYLPNNTIIHRLTGDAPKDLLIAPLWTTKKFVTMNEIDKYMRKHQLFQGKNFQNLFTK